MSISSLLTTATTATNHPIGKIEIFQPNGNANGKDSITLLKKLRNPSDLQLKLQQQLQKSRQVKAQTTYSSKDVYSGKNNYSSEEQTPLVSLDNSEDDFGKDDFGIDDFEDVNLKHNYDDEDEDVVIFKQPKTKKYRYSSADDCNEQLLRDGFRLDELSDDEDLDLIPPKPEGATWCSCENSTSCSIQ